MPITKGPERQPALERIAPLARRRLLAAHPPEERERRKRSFVIGALLFAAIGGMLGYYSLQQRPADRQSTLRRGPAPASAVANQVIPAPQPAHTSLAQGLATDSPVLPQKVAENDAVLVDADPQIPLFLYKWANAEKSTKIGELTDLYAPKLSRYFTKRDVTRAGVRAVRARNEARYGRMIMCEIKDIKVKLLDTGHAIATFRKQWQTAGPRVLITEEQDELTLIRDQGKWQIASEKRIKLYGVRKEYYAPASRRTRLGLRRSQARRSSRRK